MFRFVDGTWGVKYHTSAVKYSPISFSPSSSASSIHHTPFFFLRLQTPGHVSSCPLLPQRLISNQQPLDPKSHRLVWNSGTLQLWICQLPIVPAWARGASMFLVPFPGVAESRGMTKCSEASSFLILNFRLSTSYG